MVSFVGVNEFGVLMCVLVDGVVLWYLWVILVGNECDGKW